MRKSIPTSSLLALFLLLPTCVHAQSSVVGDGCDLAAQRIKDARPFFKFDAELRKALTNKDAGLLSLLTIFPLRVNDSRGSFYIHDASSLGGHFDQIFPDAVRNAVLKSTRNDVACNYVHIGYNYLVYVQPSNSSFGISVVNLPDDGRDYPFFKPGRIEFACHTRRSRVVVDMVENKLARYRAWNQNKSLTEKPDAEFTGGTSDVRGTFPCAHDVWTFHSPGQTIVVEQLGCSADSNPPPKDSIGTITITPSTGKTETYSYCF